MLDNWQVSPAKQIKDIKLNKPGKIGSYLLLKHSKNKIMCSVQYLSE